MKVSKLPSVDAAIRTLTLADRQKVFAWFDQLANWEHDLHTHNISRATSEQDVYVLNTTDDIRIFFRLDPISKSITVLDLAKPSRFKNIPVKAAAE